MISCVLLAAGLSTRFGSPKALAFISDKALIEHSQETLINSKVDEVIIVLGAWREIIDPLILSASKVRTVFNASYHLGQTSSFKTALLKLSDKCAGIMLLPIDYPFIKVETINYLVEVFISKEPLILVPTYNKKKGHPPIFHRRLKTDLMSLDNTTGINVLAAHYKTDTLLLPVQDQGVTATFNTPQEFEDLKHLADLRIPEAF